MSLYNRTGQPPSFDFIFNRESQQAKGLFAWWPTSGYRGTTILSERVRRLSGNVTGATRSEDRLMGSFIIFDGNDYIPLANSKTFVDFMGGSRHTLSVWAYCTTTNARKTIVGDWNSSGLNGPKSIEFGGNEISTDLISSQHRYGQLGFEVVTLNSGVTYTANTWYHIAVTWDGVNIKIYVNGTYKAQTGATGWMNELGQPAGTATLGRAGAYDGLYLSGGVADFRVYDRPMAADEIWKLYDPATRWELYKSNVSRFWYAPNQEPEPPEPPGPGGVTIRKQQHVLKLKQPFI